MERTRVEGHPNDSTHVYGLGSLSFSFVSSPEKGRKQCMAFESCRAFLHDAVRAHVHKGHMNCTGCHGYRYGDDPEIDMDRLRLLIGIGLKNENISREGFKKNLYSAKKVVNFYEEVAGWRPSRITKVDHSNYNDTWLLTGPKEWICSPQLLSMVTLVLRVGALNGPIDFKTNEDLEKVYKEWIDNKIQVQMRDRHYMRDCWNTLFLVVKHHKELFDGISTEELYTNDPHANFHSNGIALLCSLRCEVTPKLNERFEKICKREGVEAGKNRSYVNW